MSLSLDEFLKNRSEYSDSPDDNVGLTCGDHEITPSQAQRILDAAYVLVRRLNRMEECCSWDEECDCDDRHSVMVAVDDVRIFYNGLQ